MQAVRRINADGSPWFPTGKYTYLCSDNFLQGKKQFNYPIDFFLAFEVFFRINYCFLSAS